MSNFTDVQKESKEKIQEIKEEQGKKITATARNVFFGVLMFVAIIFAAIMALQIITGVFALVFSVIMLVGLFIGLRFLKSLDPVIKQKTRNIVLAKMIEEAQTRSIEQLDNMVIAGAKRLQQGRESRDKMGGYVKKLEGIIKTTNPEKDPYFEQKQNILTQVSSAYEANKDMLERAAKANKEFECKVKHHKGMAEFTKIAESALASIQGDKLEEMLGLEAFGAIDTQFNEAMVSLENSVADYNTDTL
jgi:hypothetical protein